jgi:hypothetical protein
VRSRAPALRTTTGVTPVTLGRTGERTTTARVPIRYPNSRDGPVKAGEWSSTLTVAKSGCLQAFPYRIRRYTHCLPCRRSWVRIPSAASKGCDLQVFFAWPAECVCVAVYPNVDRPPAGHAGVGARRPHLQEAFRTIEPLTFCAGGRRSLGSSGRAWRVTEPRVALRELPPQRRERARPPGHPSPPPRDSALRRPLPARCRPSRPPEPAHRRVERR